MTNNMKTKFILCGGFTPGNKDEDLSDFYKEILKDTPEKLNVLIVPFAKDEDRIIPSTERVMREFNAEKGQKELDYKIANEESFLEQLKSADIVYLQGGITPRLMDALNKFSGLGKSL